LANYVGVALFTPPSTSAVLNPPPPAQLQTGQSFWSSSSSTGDGQASNSDDRKSGPLRWTSDFPPELLAAAREEELYLVTTSSVPDSASASSVPAPNIPPAPTLPRHLDKLILNTKMSAVSPAAVQGRSRDRERDREEKRAAAGAGSSSSRKVRSGLGMTTSGTGTGSGDMVDLGASAAIAAGRAGLDFTGLADDASVLPVPSHVVLQHLCTSAIRNGVLAVGNTTRYRKKVGDVFVRIVRKLTRFTVPDDYLLQADMKTPALTRYLKFDHLIIYALRPTCSYCPYFYLCRLDCALRQSSDFARFFSSFFVQTAMASHKHVY
jgi:5'-AMP-activated protein kinase beta subunit, interaction domain